MRSTLLEAVVGKIALSPEIYQQIMSGDISSLKELGVEGADINEIHAVLEKNARGIAQCSGNLSVTDLCHKGSPMDALRYKGSPLVG